ncbi:hypothetical protein [Dactylosporangium sp. NPDC050588]|uniref:hypothetical protein n=1 Tax=Dactylosporangium sp. NPDC050588 TaxID=3157211 RepID=UPI0034070FB1
MGTADTEDPHDDRRAEDRSGAAITIAALAAVFGLAALTVVRGAGPAEVTALVVACAAAAERLVRRRRGATATRRPRRQWGPPAATKDPRPQIAEPSRRSDRELNGPLDTPDLRPRDRGVTECGDVTSLLSTHPGSDGAVPTEVRPATLADVAGGGGPAVAGRRRTDRSLSATRSPLR